jgi:thymidylate kinase
VISKNNVNILSKFKEKGCNYVILRYPHILSRKIYDLDLLMATEQDYQKAIKLMKKENFICIDKEKYRSFWTKKVDQELIVLDIYKEISWLGWKFLDKEKVFRRTKEISPLINVCSEEDELLIYSAQALFKNFGLIKYKTAVIKKIVSNNSLDWVYINKQVKNNCWQNSFKALMNKVKTGKKEIKLSNYFFIKTVLSSILNKRIFNRSFIPFRFIRLFLRKLPMRRKNVTICLLGVDGAGKSTQVKLLSQEYENLFKKFELKTKKFYFGWRPFLPITKIISKIFKKINYSIVEDMNRKEDKKNNKSNKKSGFSFIQEILLVYYFLEYLTKYFCLIFTKRNKREIILFDRYFYDMYVHYNYAEKSSLFKYLMRLYPIPDQTFLLYAPTKILASRKNDETYEKLDEHRKIYLKLVKLMPHIKIINTQRDKKESVDEMLEETWKKISSKLR